MHPLSNKLNLTYHGIMWVGNFGEFRLVLKLSKTLINPCQAGFSCIQNQPKTCVLQQISILCDFDCLSVSHRHNHSKYFQHYINIPLYPFSEDTINFCRDQHIFRVWVEWGRVWLWYFLTTALCCDDRVKQKAESLYKTTSKG